MDYQSSFRVISQQLEVLGLKWRRNNAVSLLLDEVLAMHHIGSERQDMPRKDHFAIRRVVVERRDLILREAELLGLNQIALPSQPKPVHVYRTRHGG